MFGKDAIGRCKKATTPSSAMLSVNNAVATGRRINWSEKLKLPRPAVSPRRPRGRRGRRLNSRRRAAHSPSPTKAPLQSGEQQIYHRRRVEREKLRNQQTSDDRDAERTAELRSRPDANGQGQSAQQSRHGRHHDRAKTEKTRLVNRLLRRQSLVAFGHQGKIHHHDPILLNDPDQENNPDQ